MPITVNLTSESEGVLKNFLDIYYEKDSKIDNDVSEWINVFNKPLEAIDLISSVIDNSDTFDISLRICMDAGLLVEVNTENANDIIKFMLFRYYKGTES
ncbi:MAG: hypothetical protein ACM3KR_09285 [Deltaproteobacteria bacterium]